MHWTAITAKLETHSNIIFNKITGKVIVSVLVTTLQSVQKYVYLLNAKTRSSYLQESVPDTWLIQNIGYSF
jgi:hypothetical protein